MTLFWEFMQSIIKKDKIIKIDIESQWLVTSIPSIYGRNNYDQLNAESRHLLLNKFNTLFISGNINFGIRE
ncbi:hypothetical protein RCL_jg27474.t1 [Rhizophagus clarus]|uniref:Uncharacterized protein n=1 Tax=Rhizophagus clarus TaxID=94130 RepID=A0A8H3LZE4_9GLOM|nr:hypothetical protein RCL_jg27474.t1 [Rhizophagus clarus]